MDENVQSAGRSGCENRAGHSNMAVPGCSCSEGSSCSDRALLCHWAGQGAGLSSWRWPGSDYQGQGLAPSCLPTDAQDQNQGPGGRPGVSIEEAPADPLGMLSPLVGAGAGSGSGPPAPLTSRGLGQIAAPGPSFSYLCNEEARLERQQGPPENRD